MGSELAVGFGFKRMLAYARDDNVPALKGFERAGFKRFEEVPEVTFLFFRRKKHVQESSLPPQIAR
jgi:hypothetical protein